MKQNTYIGLRNNQKFLAYSDVQGKLFEKRACFNQIKPIQLQDDEDEQYDLNEDFMQVSIQTTKLLEEHFQMSNVNWSDFIKIKKKNYLSQYKILKRLGSGGFGYVNKVISKQTSQIKAAKIIDKFSLSIEQQENLKFQLIILKKLDHPNIIKLFQVYDHPRQLVLITQLCSGGDLHRNTNKKKFKQQKVKNIIKQLLRAVNYLHQNGIVHQDIKPQNIMILDKQKDTIKLIDFGISKIFKENQEQNCQCGTPITMTPQMYKGKCDFKCDIWAIGVTMFYLISGSFPFNAPNQQDLEKEILTIQPKFISLAWINVSENCKEVIKLMLTKNSFQRPTAKNILENEYFQDQCYQIKTLKKTRQTRKRKITKNLMTFQFKNRLHAVMQTFIVSQILTNKQMELLNELFLEFDKDKNGVICAEQLRQGLLKIKDISQERIQNLMLIIDTNNSGLIDYTQFLAAGFNNYSINVKQERLKQVFQHFDKNHNGKLSYEQVEQFFQKYEKPQQDIKQAFKMFDTNKDGFISYDEFINLLLKQGQTFSQINNNKFKISVLERHRQKPISNLRKS